MQERPDYKTRWQGQGQDLAKVKPIPVRFPPKVDEKLRSLSNRSEKIRQWVIEGMERERMFDD